MNLISYFKDNFKNFFVYGSYNYTDFPIYTRSNSKTENYNGYIKNKLNNQKEINFLNFYNFLLDEYDRMSEMIIKSISDNNFKLNLIKNTYKNKKIIKEAL